MQATQSLPTGYAPLGSVTLKENRRLFIALNLLGIPWAIVCAGFFIVMASLLGAAPGSGSMTLTLADMALWILALTLTLFAALVLHELTHGLFFWLFTRSRPRFGFKGAYAYAAALGWYIPRPQVLIIGLAPLIILSLLGLLILPLLPFPASLLLLFALFANATGAIGDLYMSARLLATSRSVLIEDMGEGIRWFAPSA